MAFHTGVLVGEYDEGHAVYVPQRRALARVGYGGEAPARGRHQGAPLRHEQRRDIYLGDRKRGQPRHRDEKR